MNFLTLAQDGSDRWSQWVVLAVFLALSGGSALVKKFTEWAAAKKAKESEQGQVPAKRTAIRPRAGSPAATGRRVATPFPITPTPMEQQQLGTPLPLPLPVKPKQVQPARQVTTPPAKPALKPKEAIVEAVKEMLLGEVEVEAPGKRSPAPPVVSPSGKFPPTARPQGRKRKQASRQEPVQPHRPKRQRPVKSKRKAIRPETQEVSSLANEEKIDAEKHLGHLRKMKTGLGNAADSEATTKPIGESLIEAVRHPSRNALRKAIIMNEILGPPVGLRED